MHEQLRSLRMFSFIKNNNVLIELLYFVAKFWFKVFKSQKSLLHSLL